MDHPLIALCMIVRDEAHALPDTLNSVKDVVKQMIVLDTGSTDDTKDVAKTAGAIVHEAAFTDYASARNQALDLAKTVDSTPLYALMLSADETLHGGEALRTFLTTYDGPETCFLIELCTEMDISASPRVVKIGSPWRYEGAVHERLINRTEGKDPTALIPGVFIEHMATDPERRLRRMAEYDAPALKKEMDAGGPEGLRAMLLLGQTMEGIALGTSRSMPGSPYLSYMTQALGLYMRRMEAGGDRAEVEQATMHYLNVMETLGLYDDQEMIKRLDPIAQSKLPEIQFMIASHVARLDANAGYEHAMKAAKAAKDAMAALGMWPVSRAVIWNAHLVAAHCARALGNGEAAKKSASAGVECGGPRNAFAEFMR